MIVIPKIPKICGQFLKLVFFLNTENTNKNETSVYFVNSVFRNHNFFNFANFNNSCLVPALRNSTDALAESA